MRRRRRRRGKRGEFEPTRRNVTEDLVGVDNKARKQKTPQALKPWGSF